MAFEDLALPEPSPEFIRATEAIQQRPEFAVDAIKKHLDTASTVLFPAGTLREGLAEHGFKMIHSRPRIDKDRVHYLKLMDSVEHVRELDVRENRS